MFKRLIRHFIFYFPEIYRKNIFNLTVYELNLYLQIYTRDTKEIN